MKRDQTCVQIQIQTKIIENATIAKSPVIEKKRRKEKRKRRKRKKSVQWTKVVYIYICKILEKKKKNTVIHKIVWENMQERRKERRKRGEKRGERDELELV